MNFVDTSALSKRGPDRPHQCYANSKLKHHPDRLCAFGVQQLIHAPRILEFYFNATQRGNGPSQFKEETTVIDFQEEATKYTAALTTVWDGENSGLHLSVRTESTPKVFQVSLSLSLSLIID